MFIEEISAVAADSVQSFPDNDTIGTLIYDNRAETVDDHFRDSMDVVFEVYPWARVYVDGQLLGTTPILNGYKLLKGRYKFRFEHTEFPALEKTLNISSDKDITVDLTKEFGKIEFAVNPWGYLIIDEIEKGSVPSAKPIYIQPGEHTVKIKHPNYNEIVRVVTVEAGEILTIEEDFLK